MKNFALIGELIDLPYKSMKIIDGVKFAKANKSQTIEIKESISQIDTLNPEKNHWDYEISENEDLTEYKKLANPIFYILDSKKSELPKNLESALRLAPMDLHLLL